MLVKYVRYFSLITGGFNNWLYFQTRYPHVVYQPQATDTREETCGKTLLE